MQLETVIKLVNNNKNCLGYVKAEKLIKEIQENLQHYELVVSIRRITEKEIDIQGIINQIILPVCKAKQVQVRVNNNEVYVFTRKILKLHVLNNIFTCINKELGQKEGFEILSNYDLIRENIRSKELN